MQRLDLLVQLGDGAVGALDDFPLGVGDVAALGGGSVENVFGVGAQLFPLLQQPV